VPPQPPLPPSGGVINYARHDPRPRKSLPRRAWNWVRYHVEDRAGNAIMFTLVVIGMSLLFLITRPSFVRAVLEMMRSP
jgi:hypothetical protein